MHFARIRFQAYHAWFRLHVDHVLVLKQTGKKIKHPGKWG